MDTMEAEKGQVWLLNVEWNKLPRGVLDLVLESATV